MTLPIEGEWRFGPVIVGVHNREYQWSDWPRFAQIRRVGPYLTLRIGRFVASLRMSG